MSMLVIYFLLSSCSLIQEKQGDGQRVAFISQGMEGKSDEDTPLTGRVTIGKDFTLTLTSVKPADELTFYCQVTAGPEGSKEARTMLKVFCTLAGTFYLLQLLLSLPVKVLGF